MQYNLDIRIYLLIECTARSLNYFDKLYVFTVIL